jgi:uncharacterized membrane protein YGL010W
MTLEQWLVEYGESHRNPINKRIHWMCVPAILFSLVGLLASLPMPVTGLGSWLNWGSLALALACLYYLKLSTLVCVGMVIASSLMVLGNLMLASHVPLAWASLAIFITAWIGQFVGHQIEGRKPAFFKDLQFLLIGPAWCLCYLYRSLGLRY